MDEVLSLVFLKGRVFRKMKKEAFNYLIFVSLLISIVLIWLILLPLHKIDKIFKVNFGNKIIDYIVMIAG